MARAANERLRTAHTKVEYSMEQVLELAKCQRDPIYFIKKYVYVQHPTKGKVKFDLYPYQEKMIKAYMAGRYTVVLSARQTGKSVTSAAYLLWFAMFKKDKTILIAANKNDNAMEMILRIRYAYEELPIWLKAGVKDDGWNKHEIAFDNGSRIVSTATSENSGRGMAISLLFLDEFAFVKPNIQDEFWTSISPTLSTGGSCIMTSTPNGDLDIYSSVWRAANTDSVDGGPGANGYIPIYVAWDEPPDRGEKFKREETSRIGERRWRQEYECEFLSSDQQLIDSLFLAALSTRLENVRPIFDIRGVEFYERVKPTGTYIVGVDPSSGNGEDYSVINIFEFPSLIQVGEYRKNTMSTSKLYGVLKNLIRYLEDNCETVFFSIENNGVGNGLISLYESDDEPVVTAEFVSETGKDKLGFTTTAKSKMLDCVSFKELLEKGNMTINSRHTLTEMKSYVRYGGAYAAQKGATDDSISSILIVIRIVQEIATYDMAAYDKLYSAAVPEWDEDDWDGYEEGYADEDDSLPMIF